MKKEIVDRPELELKLAKLKNALLSILGVDYIVEEGSEVVGNITWDYQKWNSGRAVLNGRYYNASTTGTASVPSGFYLFQQYCAFPFTLNVGTILTDGRRGTGVAFTQYVEYDSNRVLLRFMSNQAGPVYAEGRVYVMGYWK